MSKLYGIIYNFNIEVLIKVIINKILKIKLLLIINLKLFYKYFIKLKII